MPEMGGGRTQGTRDMVPSLMSAFPHVWVAAAPAEPLPSPPLTQMCPQGSGCLVGMLGFRRRNHNCNPAPRHKAPQTRKIPSASATQKCMCVNNLPLIKA